MRTPRATAPALCRRSARIRPMPLAGARPRRHAAGAAAGSRGSPSPQPAARTRPCTTSPPGWRGAGVGLRSCRDAAAVRTPLDCPRRSVRAHPAARRRLESTLAARRAPTRRGRRRCGVRVGRRWGGPLSGCWPERRGGRRRRRSSSPWLVARPPRRGRGQTAAASRRLRPRTPPSPLDTGLAPTVAAACSVLGGAGTGTGGGRRRGRRRAADALRRRPGRRGSQRRLPPGVRVQDCGVRSSSCACAGHGDGGHLTAGRGADGGPGGAAWSWSAGGHAGTGCAAGVDAAGLAVAPRVERDAVESGTGEGANGVTAVPTSRLPRADDRPHPADV